MKSELHKTPFNELNATYFRIRGPFLTNDNIEQIYDALCDELSEFPIKFIGYRTICSQTEIEFIYGSVDTTENYPTEKKGDIVERINRSLDTTDSNDRYNTLIMPWGVYDINQTSNHHILVTWNQELN